MATNKQRGFVTVAYKIPAELHAQLSSHLSALNKWKRMSKIDAFSEAIVDWMEKQNKELGQDFFEVAKKEQERALMWARRGRGEMERTRRMIKQELDARKGNYHEADGGKIE